MNSLNGRALFFKTMVVLTFSQMLAFGQATGSIRGSVVDSSKAGVPNADVRLLLPGGQQAILTTRTSTGGLFSLLTLRPDTYEIEIAAPGFATTRLSGIDVDAARETPVTAELQVGNVTTTVVVSDAATQVRTGTAELSTTITREQITNLPVLGRQVSNLFLTQAGVTSGRGPTVINGLRTSLANVALDGVNVQDNFIRTNSLDFAPFRTTIDQIAEVTVTVGNASPASGGGAAQISLTTRSGSNAFHGSLYEYNRNNKFAANDWFNNRSGVARPFLNLNQLGAALGGYVVKDKLFFYVNYEAFRLRQQTSQSRTVLTPEAKRGVFNYLTTAGTQATANVLALRGAAIDPNIQKLIDQLPAPNASDLGDGLRTSGYRFNAGSNTSRNQLVSRWDYYRSTKHSLTGTFNLTNEAVQRPDVNSNFYTTAPPVSTSTIRKAVSAAWNATLRPNLINELRGGFALSPTNFRVGPEYPAFALTGLIFTTPQNQFLAQGRNTNTFSLQDNATWVKGNHEVRFGFQTQLIRVIPYDDGGTLPSYGIGISTANATGLTTADLPGVRAADIAVANSLYASLAGITSTGTRTFNIRDAQSGFVAGYPFRRRLTYDNYAGYLEDRWKLSRKLSFTLGMRYEYWTSLNEKDSLYLLPRLTNNNPIQTLLNPNAVLDFAGNSVGRPYYNPDKNNFAPNIGFAFDPAGNGKMVIRGGYSIAFANDEAITAIQNNIGTNSGLSATSTIVGQTASISNRVSLPVPTFKVPRTLADNYALSVTGAAGLPDPGLRTPYVQQWTFGIQQELKSTVFELRYVGNHGTKLLRALDYNQVQIRSGGFLDDFKRAQANGFASLAATGNFLPAFNPAIAGSQPLTVFPTLGSGGLLTNATVIQNIRQGEVGTLADLYQTNGLAGAVGSFYQNPNILGANMITNGGDSTYHALQFDVRRRLRNGLDFQANYTYSKVLGNSIGDDQARFEPYLDLNNGALERARAPFDLTHVIKGNGSYQLPLGKGRRFELSGWTDKVFGGWLISTIATYESGTPFSVFSNRGTLNRGGRSAGRNTAYSALTKNQLDQQVGHLIMTGNGPYFINPAAGGPIGTDGRGVASDGSAPFAGQIFLHPGTGTVGNLQRRMFSGPWNFNMDNSLVKQISIRERHSLELRADAFNLFNNPSFWVGSETTATTRFDINQTTFGRVNSTFNSSRVMQFSLYYRF